MYEVACEPNGKCNVDQRSFKGYLARWMAATSRVAPWTHDQIMAKLQASAKAAALQCSGGSSGTMCGLRWTLGASYDGSIGVGEQMAALEVIQSNLVNRVAGPVTSKSGGTSKGDPNAGTDSGGIGGKSNTVVLITTADRVGAGILTTIVLAIILGGGFLMVK